MHCLLRLRCRIECIAKIRPLFTQLEPMKALAGQLKKDKDSALNKVNALHQEMDKIVTRIQVIMLVTVVLELCVLYDHKKLPTVSLWLTTLCAVCLLKDF